MSDDVRWLNDDEQATWRAFLEANRIVFEQIETQLQRQSGVPHTYYEILVRLSEAPDRSLRMSELASRSFSSRSRLSHAVARLSEMGWVERVDCPTDRRGQIARLTETGFAGLAQAAPGHVETVRKQIFDALSPDQVGALRSISEALLKHAGETCTLADED